MRHNVGILHTLYLDNINNWSVWSAPVWSAPTSPFLSLCALNRRFFEMITSLMIMSFSYIYWHTLKLKTRLNATSPRSLQCSILLKVAIEPGGRDCADPKKKQKTLYVLPSVLSQSDKTLHFLLRIDRRAAIRYKKTLPKQPRFLPL